MDRITFKKPLAFALTTAAAAALVALPAGSAQAASNCWAAGFDRYGYPASYCNNATGVAVRELVDGGTHVVDRLRTNPSWFACRADFPDRPNGSSVHPYRWLWTQGDDNGAWGWVSDGDVISETNTVAVCRF